LRLHHVFVYLEKNCSRAGFRILDKLLFICIILANIYAKNNINNTGYLPRLKKRMLITHLSKKINKQYHKNNKIILRK